MQKTKLLVAVLGALIALPAAAEESSPFSSSVTLTSNYLFRGLSQSGGNAAIQGAFDYAHSSGFYLGMWASSISWLSDFGVSTAHAGMELDTYAGFKSNITEDVSYDVGFLRYNYPGSYTPTTISPNTNEIYGSIGYKWITAKYSRSLGNTFGIDKASGTNYIDLSGSYTIEAAGVTVGAHYGKQTYSGATATALKAAGTDPTYSDYNVSASMDAAGYTFGLMYSKTNAKDGGWYTDPTGFNAGKAAVVLSLSKAL